MARRKIHNKLCEIFGIDPKFADKLNKEIDEPYKILGKYHRVLFHDFDISTFILLAKYKFSKDAFLVWYLHKILDENKDLEKLLELIEMLK